MPGLKEIQRLDRLPKLERVDLSHNVVEVFSGVTSANIVEMNLSNNKITEVSLTCKMPALACLDLRYNHLSHPSKLASLKTLPMLRRLDV